MTQSRERKARTEAALWRRAAETDLYDALGTSPDASDDEIQRAWRRRARSTHPDTGGDAESFERVHLAYLILSDPDDRTRYDALTANRGAVTADPPDSPADLATASEPLPVRFLLGLALVIVAAVLLSYLWPGFTIITGVLVGVFVLYRYHRQWSRRSTAP